jgi:hypothetical protein
MFHVKDTVRKSIDHQKAGTVVEIRDMEPRYSVQFGENPADTEWIRDHDLELVAEAEAPEPIKFS